MPQTSRAVKRPIGSKNTKVDIWLSHLDSGVEARPSSLSKAPATKQSTLLQSDHSNVHYTETFTTSLSAIPNSERKRKLCEHSSAAKRLRREPFAESPGNIMSRKVDKVALVLQGEPDEARETAIKTPARAPPRGKKARAKRGVVAQSSQDVRAAAVQNLEASTRNQNTQSALDSTQGSTLEDPNIRVDRDVVGYGRDLAVSGDWAILAPAPASSKSKSTATSRPGSPTKNMKDLHLADPPIRFVEAGGEDEDPPDSVFNFLEQFMGLADGFGTLPGSLKDLIKLKLKNIESLHAVHFDETTHSPTEEDFRMWETVQEIRENARKCYEDGDSEAGWSDMVYSNVLHTALKHSAHRNSVGFKNITVANIEPKSLLPLHINGKPFGSKMVDYALVLLPNPSMRFGIRHVLQNLDDENCNINQTRYAPVRFNPIVANIEVKPPGSGKNDAMVQLAIWTAAQFNKLNELCGLDKIDIPIPLVWVEGHDWRIFIAFQNSEGELIIRAGPPFGRTGSVTGIYRIIRGIQLLAHWGETVYKPWFEKSILSLSL